MNRFALFAALAMLATPAIAQTAAVAPPTAIERATAISQVFEAEAASARSEAAKILQLYKTDPHGAGRLRRAWNIRLDALNTKVGAFLGTGAPNLTPPLEQSIEVATSSTPGDTEVADLDTRLRYRLFWHQVKDTETALTAAAAKIKTAKDSALAAALAK